MKEKTNINVLLKTTLLFLLFSLNLFAQQKKLDTVFSDCDNARIINVLGKAKVNKTIAPQNAGKINEISIAKQKTIFSFDKEHHTAWYKLNILTSGDLSFELTPLKANDDYDFMLFKSVLNFCDSLHKNNINPIRACLSRNKKEFFGKTGLSYNAKENLIKQGVGDAYSKTISVKKGEIYYLVLDNVHDHGGGHEIEFKISQITTITGTVNDESNKGVEAEISLTNSKGEVELTGKSKTDGSYSFAVPIIKNETYTINFYNDSSFSYTKTLNTTQLVQPLKTILPKLKKGNKYSVGAINFVGGSIEYLPQAVPAMQNLYKLLERNKALKIKIIGHSHGRADFKGKVYTELEIISFTRGRATTIKNYLVAKGIDEKRIEIDGRGDHEMLYKLQGATEEQMVENRRVEILVLEY
ncbi:MAG: OmpA family protein [Bacteroidota bacterium]